LYSSIMADAIPVITPTSLSTLLFPKQLRQPSSTLFPYTTLFRSEAAASDRVVKNGRLKQSVSRWPYKDIPLPEFARANSGRGMRSEEHTSELQSRGHLVCRLLLEKKKDECVWLN